jgi:hypothetical protein
VNFCSCIINFFCNKIVCKPIRDAKVKPRRPQISNAQKSAFSPARTGLPPVQSHPSPSLTRGCNFGWFDQTGGLSPLFSVPQAGAGVQAASCISTGAGGATGARTGRLTA